MDLFNPANTRKFFPYFCSEKRGDNIYFDNAATTHKPLSVINRITDFYIQENSNIHRGIYGLGVSATDQYESCRRLIHKFIGSNSSKEIILTSGATESVNLVAQTYGKKFIQKGDIILVSPIEHHANLIPWQVIAKENGAKIKELPINKDLIIDFDALDGALSNKVKLIAVNHVSNVTGLSQDIKRVVKKCKKFKIPVFVDGAQAGSHVKINVSELGCDFYCFSGHKLFGPTGTGALFVKEDILREMPPYKTGGQMVASVSFQGSKWIDYPLKFEAGTPNIAGAIGLGEAIKFIKNIDFQQLANYEQHLSVLMAEKLAEIPHLEVYGSSKKVAPIFSFNIKNIHHYDLAELLSESGVLVRSGHLCNQSLMNFLKIDGCVRASLSIYNSEEEINNFTRALKKVVKFLSKSI